MSDGRAIVLQSLVKARRREAALPETQLAPWTADIVSSFAAKAKASAAFVHEVPTMADVPHRIGSVLRDAGAPLELHIPAGSPLIDLPWSTSPELAISNTPPGGDQSAISAADCAIAETGTAVFCSGTQPSSWHFRPGREFVLVEKTRIVPRLEDVIAQVQVNGAIPATVNLVTGPSRTADIEQTIEMGAHGPRELHIFLVGQP
jgi:L-lactate dehydrogenase complex protein LldG